MFCFLCSILGHGEAQCPTRYEDDFTEPEDGFPFGNWLRANGENSSDTGAPLPLQAMVTRPDLYQRYNLEWKWGGDIFGVGKENFLNSGDSNSTSASNFSAGGRRRIDSSKLKQK